MKRRKLIRYAGTSLLTACGMGLISNLEHAQAQPQSPLSIQWFGHTCFLFAGGGRRILVNPFRKLGCTNGYRLPRVNTDLVLISSQLLDEGAVEIVPGNPRLLYEPGAYQVSGIKIQGVRTAHDRQEGKRFGINVAWKWKQAGVEILHLGGAAAPISPEQKILMGTPDILFIPVGNGSKAYTPEEAKQAIAILNPKMVVPTHYRTQAAAKDTCDILPVDNFLTLMSGTPVRRSGNAIAIRLSDLPKNGMVVNVMNYQF
ncbi:MBL fold metallo-hydrolase [Phormidium sp. CLA17]|uniref:MBL fold metallo-hydrolase n=1 Tax=Leptolyngbya sp. Cla-17 TaxID=2803751 RepID=UPI001490B3D4|nr:MBL fold metallo-hydrolase [Leptolyngbya sp. Cla-17]MBM0742956.1 MBL fold metallo-hydrolase [Leptolyngbya sp. Cla-17]